MFKRFKKDTSQDVPTENTITEEVTPETAPDQPPQSEDELLKSATSDLNTPDAEPQFKPKRFNPAPTKRKLFFTFLLVLLVAAGYAWYFFVLNKDATPAPTNTDQQSSEQTATTETLTYKPNTIAYGFKTMSADPYKLFWRPAASGERKEAGLQLLRGEAIVYSDVRGSNVAASTGKDVHISTDSGSSYKKIYEAEAGTEITSVKLAAKDNAIALGLLDDGTRKNTATSIDFSGNGKKELFVSEKAGLFILGWEPNDKLVYQVGCFNCDGGREGLFVRDLKTNNSTQLLADIDALELQHVVASDDLSKLVYVSSTLDKSIQGTGLSSVHSAAPYTIASLNLSDKKVTKHTTIGTKGEKNPNGTYRYREINVGFMAGKTTPYYTTDNTVYSLATSTPKLLYEPAKKVLRVLFVSDTTVIASSGDTTADFLLANHNVTTGAPTTILQGDNNTTLLGVTTK